MSMGGPFNAPYVRGQHRILDGVLMIPESDGTKLSG